MPFLHNFEKIEMRKNAPALAVILQVFIFCQKVHDFV